MSLTLVFPTPWLTQLKEKIEADGATSIKSDGAVIKRAARLAASHSLGLLPFHNEGVNANQISVEITPTDRWFSSLPSDTCKAKTLLFAANAYLHQRPPKAKQDASLLEIPGQSLREEQVALFEFIADHTTARKHRAVQGSTGIGKGRAIVAAGIKIFQEHGKQVVICAPTHAILKQLIAEYELIQSHANAEVSMMRAYSQADFVSADLISLWITEHSETIDVTEVSERLKNAKSYLRSEWECIGDVVDLDEVSLMHSIKPKEDPAYAEYKSMRHSIRGASIVFCTHAMVAVDLLRRSQNTKDHSFDFREYEQEATKHARLSKEIFPYFVFDNIKRAQEVDDDGSVFMPDAFFFIDEAHLLGNTISNVTSADVSLFSIENSINHLVDRKWFKKTTFSEIVSEITSMQISGKCIDQEDIRLSGVIDTHPEIQKSVESLKKSIPMFLTKARKRKLQRLIEGRRLIRNLEALNTILNKKWGSYLRLSPIRKYIKISNSGSTSQKYSHYLSLKSSGLRFVSATIHFPVQRTTSSGYEAFAINLGIDLKTLDTHCPLEIASYRNNITCTYPKAGQGLLPKNSDFHLNVSKVIHDKSSISTGGMLILFTSYLAIDEVAQHLVPIQSRLIVQKPGRKIDSYKEEYIAKYRAGDRPVWLATGAAWTGLDINLVDLKPEDDKAIQYLIIPRLPFQIPIPGHYVSSGVDAYFRFAQGIGRLVRREGREDMHLIVLDERLNGRQGHIRPCFDLINKYKGEAITHSHR